MDTQFNPVTSVDALDQLIERSQEQAVVLFKHDPHCSISAAAHRQMSRLQDVALVDVDQDDDLSQEIAQRTGIQHESPQVIVFRDGKPSWSASHYDITSKAVEQALHGG